ncbi:unnamed protein product [Trichobilharzia regenti]|nr:unnamed protein product [Trichobilharzia regenti]
MMVQDKRPQDAEVLVENVLGHGPTSDRTATTGSGSASDGAEMAEGGGSSSSTEVVGKRDKSRATTTPTTASNRQEAPEFANVPHSDTKENKSGGSSSTKNTDSQAATTSATSGGGKASAGAGSTTKSGPPAESTSTQPPTVTEPMDVDMVEADKAEEAEKKTQSAPEDKSKDDKK